MLGARLHRAASSQKHCLSVKPSPGVSCLAALPLQRHRGQDQPSPGRYQPPHRAVYPDERGSVCAPRAGKGTTAADLAGPASVEVLKPGVTQRAGDVGACPVPGCSAAAETPAHRWVFFKIILGFAITSLQSSRKPRQGWGCLIPVWSLHSLFTLHRKQLWGGDGSGLGL